MTRAGWDFEYLPLPRTLTRDSPENDFVVATSRQTLVSVLSRALDRTSVDCQVEVLLERPPLFWYRITSTKKHDRGSLQEALESAGVSVRYVASACLGSLELGEPLDFASVAVATPSSWLARSERDHGAEFGGGNWFLGSDNGVEIERPLCGTGAGTRLAVIDDDARNVDALNLDSMVTIGREPHRGAGHGGQMVGWAVGTCGRPSEGLGPFAGVAPDASPRLYCIPKPDAEIFWLPLAIARAVDDGADVIVCATYIEGMTSPMLDDALEFAVRRGRNGLGTAIVIPTSREISSPAGSKRPSLTLGLGEPASDPRVLCVAPSGREGGWFLWVDKYGRRKPFANKGPAVRVCTPGDDITYPFARDGRVGHAESSGASAVAAGVALLALSVNPLLSARELFAVLSEAVRPAPLGELEPDTELADVLPLSRDADGHDAKCGYGRLSALKACLLASDPVSAALTIMGEELAARRYLLLLRNGGVDWYSARLAHAAARLVREDLDFQHCVCVVLRHLRLVGGRPNRQKAQAPGALARLGALALGHLANHLDQAPEYAEVDSLRRRAIAATSRPEIAAEPELRLLSIAATLWGSSERERTGFHETLAEREAAAVGGLSYSA